MKAYRRKQLLERLDREASPVGAELPETVDIHGEEIHLQDFVFEIKRRETIPPEDRETVQAVKRTLREERKDRSDRIENGDITFEEGERLLEEIAGIDRALNALASLEPADVVEEAQQRERADRKRWLQFLRKALGHEKDSGRRSG